MAISLVDPSPSSVITHAGGLITVRCADFLGAARGTLSTEADALSAAGDVIRDDQAIAVQTTFTSGATRFGLAADTFTIPLSSLGREAGVDYRGFLTLKLEGEPPSNAVANSTFAMYDIENGAGLGVGYSINGSFQAVMEEINKEMSVEYQMRQLVFHLSDASTTGNLAIRAWGITGGTVSMLLDTLYLIPIGSSDADERWLETTPGTYGALTLFNDGALFRDVDDDNLWWPGEHSVFYWDAPWAPDDPNWGNLVDFQEDDSEPTVANQSGDGNWDSPPLPADPKSWMWILAGGTNIPAATLITDDFTVSSTSAPPTVGADWLREIDGYVRQVEVGTQSQVLDFWSAGRRGFFVEVGSGVATCYFGDSTGAPAGGSAPGPFGSGNYLFRAETYWGADQRLDGSSATDPRDYYPQFGTEIESFEQVCRFRLRDNAVRTSASLGQFCEGVPSAMDQMYSAWLQWDGTDLDLYLIGNEDILQTGSVFAGPVSITTSYALDDWYWLRVQKIGYLWRARAWLDGTTEPTTWDVEQQQPIQKSVTGNALVAYPYDTGWSSSVTNDTVNFDPRGGPLGIAGHDIASGTGACGIRCTSDADQARCRVECADYQMDWNAPSGTPGDMNVRLEKYDGGVDYGSVVVPYGAHRIVAADFARYHFNNDTDGTNIYAWKDSGQPDFMTAGLGRIFERAPLRRRRPQIYRRIEG